jgi:adenine-specific DNA-methyltransferase
VLAANVGANHSQGGDTLAHIHELLRQLKASGPTNAALADDLEREVNALSNRRAFGLNFERHTPEEVELPGRPVRTGDKVHVLPRRGTMPTVANSRLWRVTAIDRNGDDRFASLEAYPAHDPAETASATLADLVVVAEFHDPIYPGLVSTGKVECGDDKPHHTVINAENYHGLQTLLFTHRGRIDCIYIDPPYNTGARDWKYNNSYVEDDDLYRHSKWLAFMERRLVVAKELLNPQDSVLIVTIDEKEIHRLGLLLEQLFPDAVQQMVTIVINPLGQARRQELARVEENALILFFGDAKPSPVADDLLTTENAERETSNVRWERLLRGGTNARRIDRPNLFYPVFVNREKRKVESVGNSIAPDMARDSVPDREGLSTVWPLNTNGAEGRWRVSAEAFRAMIGRGYAKVGNYDAKNDRYSLLYLGRAQVQRVENGELHVSGHDNNGAVIVEENIARSTSVVPKTVWNRPSHRAGEYGSGILRKLIPGRNFPFPKSLYAVEDILRPFIKDKPNAVVLDFFAGSGTTAHAVMRLNKQDGGLRRSISVTNNEVSADEQRDLRKLGLRPGDVKWEVHGICDFVTKPRIEAAITGATPDGIPIQGDYKFTDEFPMADGFNENVEFFTMTYEAPLRLRANRDFEKVAPLLWIRAGSRGRRINSIPDGWAVADTYGVLADLDQTDTFVEELSENPSAVVAFIITDDDSLFEAVVHGLPIGVEPVRMYDAYLRNFEIDAMRGVR